MKQVCIVLAALLTAACGTSDEAIQIAEVSYDAGEPIISDSDANKIAQAERVIGKNFSDMSLEERASVLAVRDTSGRPLRASGPSRSISPDERREIIRREIAARN